MVVQYFQFLPIFKGHILLYKAFILLIIIMIYSTFLILITMAFRIKYRKIKNFWIVNILRFTLPIISYFFRTNFYCFNFSILLQKRREL